MKLGERYDRWLEQEIERSFLTPDTVIVTKLFLCVVALGVAISVAWNAR